MSNDVMIKVPKGWCMKTISEVAEIFGGGTPDTKRQEFWNGDIDWYTPTEITSRFVCESNRKITLAGMKNCSAKLLPAEKTILLTTRATLGEMSIPLRDCCTNQGFQSLVFADFLDRDFIYYNKNYIQTKIKKFAKGSTFAEISKTQLGKIELLFPNNKQEQKKIIKILNIWQEAIELQEQLIKKLELQKKGLMGKLLKQRKINEVKKICLIDLCSRKPQYGLNEAATDDITLPKYLRITDINDNGNFVYQGAHVQCCDDGYKLKPNDIVFARTGASVGKSYLYKETDGELAFAGFLIKFSIDPKKANPSFISYCCNTKEYWKWVEINCARSGQPGINSEEYSSLSLPYFNFTHKEQQHIADIIFTAEKRINLYSQKLALLKQQRKALMQLLLTGIVRVGVKGL